MKKLSAKQELFCQEYIKDLNGKQSAIRAKYSPNTAEVQACRLLKNVKVHLRLAELQAAGLKENAIDASWVLQQAVEVHNRCMAATKVIRQNGEPVIDEDGCPVYTFQHAGANKSLEIIGKHIAVAAFSESVSINHKISDLTPWSTIQASIDK
jgi:phage terminase small subunit